MKDCFTCKICSLVPRPSLTAFFAAVEKSLPTLFSTAAKKAVREGLGTRLQDLSISVYFCKGGSLCLISCMLGPT